MDTDERCGRGFDGDVEGVRRGVSEDVDAGGLEVFSGAGERNGGGAVVGEGLCVSGGAVRGAKEIEE